MTDKELLELAAEYGFDCAAPMDVTKLDVLREVRDACKATGAAHTIQHGLARLHSVIWKKAGPCWRSIGVACLSKACRCSRMISTGRA